MQIVSSLDCRHEVLRVGDKVVFIDPNWEKYNARLQVGEVVTDEGKNLLVKSPYHKPFPIDSHKVCKIEEVKE